MVMMALKVFLLKRQLIILLNLSLIFSHCLWKLELSLRIWKLLGLYQFLRPVTPRNLVIIGQYQFSRVYRKSWKDLSFLDYLIIWMLIIFYININMVFGSDTLLSMPSFNLWIIFLQLLTIKNLLLESSWTWVRHSIWSVTVFWLLNLVDTEWRMLPWDGLEAT